MTSQKVAEQFVTAINAHAPASIAFLNAFATRKTSGVPNESPESECSSGRADQLHDGVCSIEQRQHGRHHEQEKSMERRFAILYRSATDIVERRCLVIKVRFGEPMTHTRSVRARSISMINLEYRFHANSSEFRSIVSGL